MKKRKYEGSSDYLGAFGLATVFTFVGILGIIFLIANIDFIGLKSWGYYLFIPAFFIWIGGISTYINQQRLKREVLAALESYTSSPANIDILAKDLMMERSHLMRLLIDLRTDRWIKFRVDPETGELFLGETFAPPVINKDVTPITTTDTIFCPQCGIRMPAESRFCPNCGASIQ